MSVDVGAFLARCDASSSERRAALRELAQGFQSEQSRAETWSLCQELRERTQGRRHGSFRVVRFPLRTSAVDDYLDLVLTPSIFSPEEWSYTFLEGLLRRPRDDYEGLTAIELGTGSGWVSLALLRHTPLRFIRGLDLNPDAACVAGINAYLNSFGDKFEPRVDSSGRALFERFEAETSDLLSTVRSRSDKTDLIVGCIPQVLSDEEMVADSTEESLHDLSNYFVRQGVEEDRFGLGLLARALEESIEVLKVGGRIILNIASRPGVETINAMFGRRGFDNHILWQRRVKQAGDTDIRSLVTLEKLTGSAFEFYVNRQSQQPIPASTAYQLVKSRGEVWHDIRVIEARLLFERDLRPFMTTLRDELGFSNFLKRLDLSALNAEQLSFLRVLARSFCDPQWGQQKRAMAQNIESPPIPSSSARVAPYTHEAGSRRLRQLVADYVRRYHDLDLGQPIEEHGDRVFIGPDRVVVFEGLLLSLCEAGDAILMSESLFQDYEKAGQRTQVEFFRANDDLRDVSCLVEALNPKLVLVSLDTNSMRSGFVPQDLDKLVETCSQRDVTLVVDGSHEFDISSRVPVNRLLDYAARQGLGGGFLILIGLTKNRVYPDLKPGLLLGLWPALNEALKAFAEASYSRNGSFTEQYYCQLFEDVLSFQLSRPGESGHGRQRTRSSEPKLSRRMRQVMSCDAFKPSASIDQTALPVIRLDYGENELELPDELIKGLFLGFTNLLTDVSPEDLRETLSFTAERLMQQSVPAANIVVGAGVFPLLYDLCLVLQRRQAGKKLRVGIPRAHYGYVLPIFTMAGIEPVVIETRAQDQWLLTADALNDSEAFDILWFNNPSNPAGLCYPKQSLEGIADVLEAREITVFNDEIFALLSLTQNSDRCSSLLDFTAARPQLAKRCVTFNGLSKAFAAGGLRVGFAFCGEESLAHEMRALSLVSVSRHARLATQILFRGFRDDPSTQEAGERVRADLESMRTELRCRRSALESLFKRHGLRVCEGEAGGLFVLLELKPLIGQSIRTGGRTRLIGDEATLHEVLLKDWGLRINSGRWSGTPGYVRVCYSLERGAFDEALRRWHEFLSLFSEDQA